MPRSAVDRALAELDERVDSIDDTPPVDTEVAPWLRPLVSTYKRAGRRGLAWYTRWQSARLRDQGTSIASVVKAMSEELADQARALGRLERKIRELERTGPTERGAGGADASSPAARSAQVARSVDYVQFENTFRGSEEDVARRQSRYVELFRSAPGRVVDLGCGRGEFLRLLREGGLDAYGVDMDPDMVSLCQSRGLNAVEGDVLDHLRQVPGGTLGGVFSAQMVEHLDPAGLIELFELAAEALAPRGVLAVETLNPASLLTFASALYVDPGHVRPLHPDTLRFLADRSGFVDVRIEFLNRPADEQRLRPLDVPKSRELAAVVEAVNENIRRLDALVYGPLDYAVIAVSPVSRA